MPPGLTRARPRTPASDARLRAMRRALEVAYAADDESRQYSSMELYEATMRGLDAEERRRFNRLGDDLERRGT